jgi:2,3,4,5-tetrahydropyridine-2-carboxylate N-succinyltransferase
MTQYSLLQEFQHDNLKQIRASDVTSSAKTRIEELLFLLNSGKESIVTKKGNEWVVNQEAKLAIYLSFLIRDNNLMNDIEDFHGLAFDKFSSKFTSWKEDDFKKHKIRVLPNCLVRYSAFIDEGAILMPSFINVGAHVGKNTMIDTWSTVGSCAHIGDNVHISGGVGIGGVLEPINANPVIIEDNCFIGARSEICEGVIVEEGSVIAMGCYIGKSTKIINRETGETTHGKIPKYSVVVPGNYPYNSSTTPGLSGYCVIIIKQVNEETRKKVGINELLRS